MEASQTTKLLRKSEEASGVGNREPPRHTAKGGGSNPSPRTIIWGQRLGLPECPYMRRWVIDFKIFAIRVHRWQGSDDARAFHDHPWWFLTLVLRGSYTDVSPDGRDQLRAGSIRYRPAHHRHNRRHRSAWNVDDPYHRASMAPVGLLGLRQAHQARQVFCEARPSSMRGRRAGPHAPGWQRDLTPLQW